MRINTIKSRHKLAGNSQAEKELRRIETETPEYVMDELIDYFSELINNGTLSIEVIFLLREG